MELLGAGVHDADIGCVSADQLLGWAKQAQNLLQNARPLF